MSKTSLIEVKSLRFLIMDAPKDTNLHMYLKECKKNNVTHIVRISEPSYSKDEVEKAGICLNVSLVWGFLQQETRQKESSDPLTPISPLHIL